MTPAWFAEVDGVWTLGRLLGELLRRVAWVPPCAGNDSSGVMDDFRGFRLIRLVLGCCRNGGSVLGD